MCVLSTRKTLTCYENFRESPFAPETRGTPLPTPRQLARTARILDTAALLTVDGGFARVQMRDVAEHAGVALSTLYRHHPTKTHLVLAVMERELLRARERFVATPPEGDDDVARVLRVLERIATSWHDSPASADAMLQAYLTAGADEGELRARVSTMLQELLVLAMWGAEHDARPGDADVARMLETQLVGSLAAWAAQRATQDELLHDLRTAGTALLRTRAAAIVAAR